MGPMLLCPLFLCESQWHLPTSRACGHPPWRIYCLHWSASTLGAQVLPDHTTCWGSKQANSGFLSLCRSSLNLRSFIFLIQPPQTSTLPWCLRRQLFGCFVCWTLGDFPVPFTSVVCRPPPVLRGQVFCKDTRFVLCICNAWHSPLSSKREACGCCGNKNK